LVNLDRKTENPSPRAKLVRCKNKSRRGGPREQEKKGKSGKKLKTSLGVVKGVRKIDGQTGPKKGIPS